MLLPKSSTIRVGLAGLCFASLLLITTAAQAVTFNFESVVVNGDIAPGTGGATFISLFSSTLNDNGDIAILGDFSGGAGTGSNTGLFSNATGSLSLVAEEGDTAPGTGGATIGQFRSAAFINNNGDIAFVAELSGNGVTSDNDRGIFSDATGSLSLVAREGDTAPGTGGATFDDISSPTSINNNGDTAFRAELTGNGVTGANDRGIFSGTSGALSLVVREGDTVPGTGGGTFASLGNRIAQNDNGDTVFRATISGGTTNANDSGLFSGPTGAQSLVVREGDTAPGTGGATFDGFFGALDLNNNGDMAFTGLLTGSGVTGDNDLGIFSDATGSLSLVARKGDVAPGTGGATFGFLLSNPVLNDNGDMVFAGFLAGNDVTSDNDLGLFSYVGGILELIIREGDTLDIGSGNLRTISQLFVVDAVNSSGQFSFRAQFTDRSYGVFIASPDLAAVPIPAALPLFGTGLALMGVVGWRRKRRLSVAVA